ncbi:MAG: sporulation transcriptional regulator SpoIIID [Candidatus Scatosoma sp.]
MWEYIEERVRRNGEYIVETGCTVRACAKRLGASKSTVHKDVTERLAKIDPALYEKAKAVLEFNLSERHLRGGNATKRKYEERRKTHEPRK